VSQHMVAELMGQRKFLLLDWYPWADTDNKPRPVAVAVEESEDPLGLWRLIGHLDTQVSGKLLKDRKSARARRRHADLLPFCASLRAL
jgi:hypothetical protein